MKKETFRIKGKRVFLRYPEASDLEEFTTLARKSERFHRGLMSMAKTPAEYASYLERSAGDASKMFLICRTLDGAIVGMINLSQIVHGLFKSAYLGYGLGVPFTGNGFATEAVQLATRYAFTKLGLHRLEANIQPHNRPSIEVAKRCGYRKEGYSPRYLKIGGKWCDHERWAITKEDWKGK
jgi:ribosomal-protein-alanine N-acetyltransferase